MANTNNMTLTEAVELILGLGFVVLGKPTAYKRYYLGQGSIANGRTVELSGVETKRDPAGDPHLAVYVRFKGWSEAGEDLCDYHTEDARWVRVARLREHLDGLGVRFYNEKEVS